VETSAKRIGRMIAAVLCSFLVALGVGVVAALVADGTRTCSSGDCEDSLLALAVLMISLAVVPVIVLPIVASLARLGLVFVAGSTVALALIGIGTFGLAMGWYLVFYPLGVAVLVVTMVLANRPATPFARHRCVIVAVLGFALVSAAAIPLIVKVGNVRTEQRAITKLAEKPLQPVRGDGQWAHVTSSNFVENKVVQDERNSRAEQVARQLRPRSAWRLGASAADCGFCEWFG
jgi:hypothetical protein